ncbi:MAG: heme-binding protein [Rhodospirillaceae bacterium]|nr:heme-binding protein [Rhodospirillaceae bacterium]
MTLTHDMVRAMVDHALAGPRVHPSIRMAVAVVDAGGYALMAVREIGAPPLLLDIAESKAKSCVAIGMPTRAIMDLALKKPTWFESASRVAQSRVGLPIWGALGGVIMRDGRGELLGAVATAGDTGVGDEAHAKRAIESVGLIADVEGLDVEW